MGNQLAVESIFRNLHPAILRHNLCGAHAVVIVDEVDLAGLHIVVEGRGGGKRTGEAVVHAQRAGIQRIVRAVGGRSSHLQHAVFDGKYIIRVGGRRGMARHQAVVDLHGAVAALSFSVGAAELHVPIDLLSGQRDLLQATVGIVPGRIGSRVAAGSRPVEGACGAFIRNLTIAAKDVCLQHRVAGTHNLQHRLAVRIETVGDAQAAGGSACRHRDVPQLSTCTPGVGALAVKQRIANLIVGDANSVVGRELNRTAEDRRAGQPVQQAPIRQPPC